VVLVVAAVNVAVDDTLGVFLDVLADVKEFKRSAFLMLLLSSMLSLLFMVTFL
jgi:hypothetical protein